MRAGSSGEAQPLTFTCRWIGMLDSLYNRMHFCCPVRLETRVENVQEDCGVVRKYFRFTHRLTLVRMTL